ncbi:MAG: glycosyltransferase family 2 protein [Burkholderiales bacterium]
MSAMPKHQSAAAARAAYEHDLPSGISAVVPVYNSEITLPKLVSELSEVLPQCNKRFEVVLVNDDSRDQSWEVICGLAREYPFVRGINLTRNFGQHNATLCGVHAARFEITVTMDDDLQDPPSQIPQLLAKLEEGFDLVYGTAEKKAQSWWRDLGSRVMKKAHAVAMRQPALTSVSSFRAFRTSIRTASLNYASPRLLIDVLLGWGTTRITAAPIRFSPRKEGQSNYSFGKLFEMTVLLWTSYTTVPLRIASLIGFLFVLFGMFVLAYVLATYFIEGSLPGFPFLASLIAIFGGVQLFTLGVVGEYLANIFDRSLNRPIYMVKSVTEVSSLEDAR